MSAVRVRVALLGFFLFASYGAAAQEPFYQGKRLTILVRALCTVPSRTSRVRKTPTPRQ